MIIALCVLVYLVGLSMATFAPTEDGGAIIIIGSILMLISGLFALSITGSKF